MSEGARLATAVTPDPNDEPTAQRSGHALKGRNCRHLPTGLDSGDRRLCEADPFAELALGDSSLDPPLTKAARECVRGTDDKFEVGSRAHITNVMWPRP